MLGVVLILAKSLYIVKVADKSNVVIAVGSGFGVDDRFHFSDGGYKGGQLIRKLLCGKGVFPCGLSLGGCPGKAACFPARPL